MTENITIKDRKISLKGQHQKLAEASEQLKILEQPETGKPKHISFEKKLESSDLYPLKPTGIEIFQVNIGKMCNQTCKHCHVDAGPDRQEIMTRETMQHCLECIKKKSAIFNSGYYRRCT